jgi:hypothetical protein
VNLVYFIWGVSNTNRSPHAVKTKSFNAAEEVEVLKKISSEELLKRQVAQQAKIDKCFIVGDFTNKEKAVELERILGGLQNQIRVVPLELRVEFRVLFPAGESWEESQENVEILKNKGVTDLWLIRNGEDKGVIALGLFLTEERANAQVKALNEKQVDAKIIARKKFHYQVQIISKESASKTQTGLNNIDEGVVISGRCSS